MTTSKRTPRRAGSSAQSEHGAGAGSSSNGGAINASPAKARVRRTKPPADPKKRPAGDDRLALIAQAAYFRSEHRGFQPGHELEDWLAAEAEVDQRSPRGSRASARR
jgi:hypothetical protein